ncbi:expressed protein [Phakopsora pachyrhizi]|uniref:Expressed protein n=1 Tax=Phakopsora pachyrhizi TaxID=170000 RepID=A0AAV0AM55_PHAPC|nr:expressed protein [Phakopsora pachyrhizi]
MSAENLTKVEAPSVELSPKQKSETPAKAPEARESKRKGSLRLEIKPLPVEVEQLRLVTDLQPRPISPALIPIPGAELGSENDWGQDYVPTSPATYRLTFAPHLSLLKYTFSPLPPLTPFDSQSVFAEIQIAYLESIDKSKEKLNEINEAQEQK